MKKKLLISLIGLIALVVVSLLVALHLAKVSLVSQALVWEVPVLKTPGHVRLLFVGDTGMGGESQTMVSHAMEKACDESPTDGVVMLGDNFYMDGVTDPSDTQWQTKFESIYGSPCLSELPFFAVLGNHDYKGNPAAQIEYSKLHPSRWVMPARAYALRFSDVVNIAMVDTNFPDYCGLSLCSLDAVGRSLAAQPARWTLAAGHHPVLSGGKYPNMKSPKNWFFKPFLCHLGVSVYFAGHDHNLQHLYLDPSQSGTESCTYDHVIVGGGGGPLNEVRALPDATLFQMSAFGFSVVSFDRTQMSVGFRSGQDNSLLYSFSK